MARLVSLALAVISAFAALDARAALIDFESVPGSSPSELLAIDTQFLATAGVRFALEGGGSPVLAQVGSPLRAFEPDDTPDDPARHGSFFLTDDGDPLGSLTIAPLIVSYSTPTMTAGGDLIDIDFDEALRIEARDAADQVLAAIVICVNAANASCLSLGGATGTFATGDGVTTPWSIARAQADIRSLRISGMRNLPGGFGMAFDNFETGVVPEPGTGALLASALAWLARPARRQSRRSGSPTARR